MTEPIKRKRGRVLVVDDDTEIRGLVRDLLEIENYGVATAGSGTDALRVAGALSEPPALVLLDLMMPDMDGLQFRAAQLAVPNLKDVPVVVMSGDTRLRERADAMSVAAYLQKPFDLDEMLGLVGKYAAPMVKPPEGPPTGAEADAHAQHV
ncbi:MAG: response regulator [Myxococcaceae bacterium]